jgi:hypothetical protein
VPTTLVGAPGTVAIATEVDAVEYGPSPIAFFANTLNVYKVPVERPLTDVNVLINVPSANVVQFEPLSLEY